MSTTLTLVARAAARTTTRPLWRAALLWVARAGAAGLLVSLALAAVRPGQDQLAAALAGALGLVVVLPLRRALLMLASGTAALTGLVATAGAVAALAAERVPSLLAVQWHLVGSKGLPGAVALDAVLAVGVLCLALACLPASGMPAGATAAALAGWAFALPVVLATGHSAAARSSGGGLPAGLEAGLAALLRPFAGAEASLVARCLVLAACASGALVAFATASEASPDPAGLPGPGLVSALRLPAPLLAGALGASLVALAGPKLAAALPVCAAAAGALALSQDRGGNRALTKQMKHTATALSGKALPALLEALEARTGGAAQLLAPSVANALAELEGAARHLESARGLGGGEAAELARALAEASRQVGRLATGLEGMSRAEDRRLEELVGQRTAALSSVNRHLVDTGWRRRQLLDRTVQAAEGERARLAANLHDGPVQRLAALGLVLDRCRLRLDRQDTAGAVELVERARAGLGEEVRSLRQIMSELRPPVLDEGGLEAAIRDHLTAWSATTGIDARLAVSELPKLPSDSETVAYRVVQEALANVAKHAKASHVVVSIGPAGAGVELTVRDDGRGFRKLPQPELLRAGHFGLVVMRERVELAAGRFEVTSAPLSGTKVTFWLPASAPAPDLSASGASGASGADERSQLSHRPALAAGAAAP
jgi:signal transduction histidine kinase